MTTENYTFRVCSVEGCDRRHKALGYCLKHYRQHQNGGIKQEATHCTHCRAPFEARLSNGMYCSNSCKIAAWRKANPDRYKFHRSKKATPAPNRSNVYAGYCIGCGLPFVSRRKKLYCRAACCKKTEYKSIAPDIKKCKHCGGAYSPLFTGGRPSDYCSETCLSIADAANKRIHKARRGAILKHATVERVDPFKVFDRDGWRCQLCGARTPKDKRGTYDKNAPELDHIIPLSKGGEHSYVNTQCSCRKCNIEKSDKPMGQLLLIG